MQYDVIIVLAGGIQETGEIPLSVQRRLQKAKLLYEQKAAERILLSGRWSKYWEKRNPPSTEAEAMRQYALQLGIPDSALLKEERSHNTFTNAQYCTELFIRPQQWKRIAVVTSDFHVPRAKAMFLQHLGTEYDLHFVSTQPGFHPLKWVSWRIRELIWRIRRKLSPRFTDELS